MKALPCLLFLFYSMLFLFLFYFLNNLWCFGGGLVIIYLFFFLKFIHFNALKAKGMFLNRLKSSFLNWFNIYRTTKHKTLTK